MKKVHIFIMSIYDTITVYHKGERNKVMDLMTILFGYFVFKSIFKETKQCDFGNNDCYSDDCDESYDSYDDYI